MLPAFTLLSIAIWQTSTASADVAELQRRHKRNAVNHRLPTTWHPTVYTLDLKVYLPSGNYRYPNHKHFTIEGRLRILLTCTEPTNFVTLHQVGLNIAEPVVLTLDDYEGDSFSSTLVRRIPEADMVQFEFEHYCKEGRRYSLYSNYTGRMSRNSATGIYTNTYEENGITKWFVATQTAPRDCRKLLPLFDEPLFKAAFVLTITHPSGTTALANGKQMKQERLSQHWTRTTFEPTLNMSSYLLAMFVSTFAHTSANIERNSVRSRQIHIRTWSRPDVTSQMSHAMEIMPRLLKFFEEYFGIQYPLPKLDIVALPKLWTVAMENWGLINFRETSVLYKNSHSLLQKQEILTVSGHEMAHQWFGNLVTMKWWDDLWLKESIPTFLQYLAGDHVTSDEFHLDDQFVSISTAKAMAKDQKASAHPLRTDVGVFDDITYHKGAAIVCMISKVIGANNFRNGLSRFLRKYQFTNADTDDLWQSVTETVRTSSTAITDWNNESLRLSEFAASWTLQIGYPLITVREVLGSEGENSTDKRRFSISQESVELHPYAAATYYSRFRYIWKVPLPYVFGNDDKPVLTDWLVTRQKIVSTDRVGYILIDPDSYGYYRVNYDNSNWLLIRNRLLENLNAISPKTRARLIQDAFMFARGKQLKYTVVLTFVQYLANEAHYLGWDAALDKQNLGLLDYNLKHTDAYELYKVYMKKLITGKYSDSYWRGLSSDPRTQMFEVKMIKNSCYYGHEHCIARAKLELIRLLEKCYTETAPNSRCNSITLVLRPTVYCYGIQASNQSVWMSMWQAYTRKTNAQEKTRILQGLTCTKDPVLIQRLLMEVTYGSVIPTHDISNMLEWLSSNTFSAPTVWRYFNENYNLLEYRFGRNVAQLESIVSAFSSSSLLKTKEIVHQMKSLTSVHSYLARSISYKNAINIAETKLVWMNEYYNTLHHWLQTTSQT